VRHPRERSAPILVESPNVTGIVPQFPRRGAPSRERRPFQPWVMEIPEPKQREVCAYAANTFTFFGKFLSIATLVKNKQEFR
jgi:hypothetical protein